MSDVWKQISIFDLCDLDNLLWHEVNEDIFKGGPVELLYPAMYQPGRLVPDHLPGGEDDLVQRAIVVIDLQWPVAVHLQTPGQATHNPSADVHLLLDVEDGGDDVGPQVVQVTQ